MLNLDDEKGKEQELVDNYVLSTSFSLYPKKGV